MNKKRATTGRPYGYYEIHCRGDHWSPAFICRDFFVFSGRRRRRPLQDLVFFVGTDVLAGPFLLKTSFLESRVSVAPDFSREPKRGFTSRRLSVSVLTTLFFDLLLESFWEGVRGNKVLSDRFPRSSYQISNNFLKGVIYAAARAASDASAKMRSRGSVPEKRQITKESSAK